MLKQFIVVKRYKTASGCYVCEIEHDSNGSVKAFTVKSRAASYIRDKRNSDVQYRIFTHVIDPVFAFESGEDIV